MKIILRAIEVNAQHTHFIVFVNGANCGKLCMSNEEAIAFYLIVLNGCNSKLDTFLGQGQWEEKPKEQRNN